MTTNIAAIRNRISVRTYERRPIEPARREELTRALEGLRRGPFGTELRLALVDLADPEGKQTKGLWTYGIIRGATTFLVGAIRPAEAATIDYGHCFERAILEATRLGLGTCWLGGTFNRSVFAQKLELPDGWLVPAVSPVGYGAERRSLQDRALRLLAGSNSRKPWRELFFADAARTPLAPESCGRWSEALECVRLAPSASNGQPWRVVAEPGLTAFHFGLQRKRAYDTSVSTVSLQEVDLGIGLSHFELACRELGLAGGWRRDLRPALPEGVEYVATWS